VPSPWNGTLLLYSHGFGPPQAADAPDASTKQALLDRGYALVGSSYDPGGSWWALSSALRDQFEALDAVRTVLPSKPREVIAFGTSMGGLISALESERGNGRIDGALTTCGIVAGAIHLNNYQLDGEYAIAKLLAPAMPIKLVRFANPDEGLATGKQFDAIAQQAESTPQGRARLALAMAFLNVPTWAPGQPMPAADDYAAQEQQQFDIQFSGAFTTMDFIESGRPWIEQAAGGNGSWTVGVDFARQLARSPYAAQIRALYGQAGLDLRSDLNTLTAGADIRADAPAVRSLAQTSVPSGRLQVPSSTSIPSPTSSYRPSKRASTLARCAVRGARRRRGPPSAPGIRRAPGSLQLHSRRAGRRCTRDRASRGDRPVKSRRHAAEPPGNRDQPGTWRRSVHPLPPVTAHGRQRSVRAGLRAAITASPGRFAFADP
jgi:hypothetical protein